MTTAMVKIESKEIKAHEGTINPALVDRWLAFASVSENSEKTYRKPLKKLFAFFAANDVRNPSREDLQSWLASLKAEGKSPSTINLYLSATKLFFRWLHVEGFIERNIADHMKGVKPSRGHKKDALDTDQCKTLVDSVEVVRADVGDIRFERGKKFLYVQGKGRSDRDEKVLLSKQTVKAIDEYLRARGTIKSNEPLFVSTSRRNKGARLDAQTISRLVKRQLRAIGFDSPRFTAHSLRHSVATNLIFEGVELPTVQQVLRHSSISTTLIYADAWKRHNNISEQILADKIFGAD
jgi:integrase/recombinase XerC